jgi:epidermal growth factor receptor substrate 15
VDPQGTGAIQALDAARFLKKSYLSDVVLSKIWDLSDPTGKGYLDKVKKYQVID